MGRERSKRRSHAKIPPEMHERVAEWCAKQNERDADGKVVPRTGGLAYAQDQLAADGLKVSLDTLSRFFSWWELEQDLELSFEREQQVLGKTGDPKKAREAGETLLMRLGVAHRDPKLIVAAAQTSDSRRNLDLQEESGKTKARQKERALDQKDEAHRLAERKFQRDSCKLFLKWFDAAEAKRIATSGLSNTEKIEQLGLAMFGEDWKS